MPLTSVTQNPSQSAAIVLAFAAGVAVGANWPKIRKSMAPLMAVVGDRLGDVYSTVAQAVGEQKEAMEDSRAERRHRTKTKTTSGVEQELLASLAATLLQGGKKRRTAARPARKRRAPAARKTSVATAHAADGNP